MSALLRLLVPVTFFALIPFAGVQANSSIDSSVNPLASFSPLWNAKTYNACNTAENVSYMTANEKQVIWILNMVRLNPKLFLTTVLLNPKNKKFQKKESRNRYFKSLIEDLKIQQPNNDFLTPDSLMYASAYCHAYQSGQVGYIGHDRSFSGCQSSFYGECCEYGNEEPIYMLLNLLIDEGISSLGHRKVCLKQEFQSVGVSMQPHKGYGINTVLDFNY
jgi:hypothetical protein